MAAKMAKGGWNLRAGKIWLASRGHQAEIGDRIAVKGGGTGCLRPGLAASFVLACLLRRHASGGLHQVMKRARNRCAMCGKAHA